MIKTLFKSVREYKLPSILSPIFVSCEVLLECIIPLIMAQLIDHMNGDSLTPVIHYGIILVIMAMASLFFGSMAARQASKASCGLAKNLRHDLFYKVQQFSFPDIDIFSPSSLVTRMTTDVTNVQNAYQMFIRGLFRSILMMIFSIVMAFTINTRMALIFVIIMPIMVAAIFGIMYKVIPFFHRIFKKYDEMNNTVQENVEGIRVVKSFVREDYEKTKFQKRSEEVRRDFTTADRIMALNAPVMMFCLYASIIAISYFGAQIIITTQGSALTTGALSSLITYGVQMLMAIMMLSMVFVLASMAQESAIRITEILNHEASIVSPENGLTAVADGSIDFDGVSFRYSDKSEKYALSDIDLHIPSGMTVGIIGGTGSSKTTLIQLISRLYDVSVGSVKVGGHDVREYDLETLRNAVAVVLQKNVLFSGTINDNLRWGKKDATDEEIRHVCHLAQADEFIEQFPDQYETMITQGGTNVSGGQKQRLCIARALLKDPKVLILDDSTSAVDTRTDALIRKAFREEIPDTTKLIIAQRVSSVEDADMILVMEGGRIVEQGNHDELMAYNGIYREIYDSQTKGKEA